jgi:hypothetical protein
MFTNTNTISNKLISQKYNEIDKTTNEITEKVNYLDNNGKNVKEKDIEFIDET